MKLQPITDPRPGQMVKCEKCGRMIPADKAQADMEGVPYQAYYHPECVPACQIWEYVDTVQHPGGSRYFTWKAVTVKDESWAPAGTAYYNITKTPHPPTGEAGYFSYAYLLAAKNIKSGLTVQNIFQDHLKTKGE